MKKDFGFPSSLTIAFLAFFAFSMNAQTQKPVKPPLFKVDVETVFVKVSVTDPLNTICDRP